MGQFRFIQVEKTWQDVLSNFDDDDVDNYIQELKAEGYSYDCIYEKVRDMLMDNCWDDYDYGEVFDSETIDTDFDNNSDSDNLENTVEELMERFYEAPDDEPYKTGVLGGLEDD